LYLTNPPTFKDHGRKLIFLGGACYPLYGALWIHVKDPSSLRRDLGATLLKVSPIQVDSTPTTFWIIIPPIG